MIQDWRFFTTFEAKTLETERKRPTGSPQGRNSKEIARGKPENVRRRVRRFAGSPKMRNWAREARGKPARKKLRE